MEKTIVPILRYHSIQNIPKSEVRSQKSEVRSHADLTCKATGIRFTNVATKKLGYRGCPVSEAICALSEPTGEKLVARTLFTRGLISFHGTNRRSGFRTTAGWHFN